MPAIYVNDAGTNKAVKSFHVNDAGTVKPIKEAYVNDAGTNKKFWPSVGVPSTVSDLRVTGSTVNSVALAWTLPSDNGSALTFQWIEYGTDGVNFPTGVNVGTGGTTANITGLSSNTTYYFRQFSTNAYGNSSYSNVVQGTTSIATAPQAPSVYVSSEGSGSITMQITAGGGGTPTAYEVDRALNTNAGQGPFSWTNIQANLAYTGSPQQFQDTGVVSATCYAYRVRAKNGAGTSGYSGNTYGNTLGNVAFGSIGCGIDPEDVGTFKDTGFGTNSAASGNAGQSFGSNYVGSVGGVTLARFARSGSTTMTIWLEAASVDPGLFTRISIGSGQYAYSANVSPAGSPGGPQGTLWVTSWSVPSLVAGDWVDGANVSVNIGK